MGLMELLVMMGDAAVALIGVAVALVVLVFARFRRRPFAPTPDPAAATLLPACRECRGRVSADAQACPHCGAPRPGLAEFQGWGFEWKSKATLFGIPLVHVAIGRDRNHRMRVAKGIVAIGQFAVGVVTVAQFGAGIVGLGQFMLGWAVVGQIALASIASIGQLATGGFATGGQMAVGRPLFGQLGVPLPAWACGVLAVALSVAAVEVVRHVLRRAAAAPAPAPEKMAAFLAEAPPPTRPAPPEDVLPNGTQVGPYRIADFIGRGGMGAVYRAEHTMIDRTVALKILPRALADDPEFVERFKREAQALAKLQHPNIVSLYDVGRDGDVFYFAMEHIDGANLRSVMRAGGLTPAQALHLVPKLCDALEVAHAHGIVHRDVKPENILIGRDGEPRIADFGLARLVRGGHAAPTLTRTDAFMGTPDYMAPEQRESMKAVDGRADIYSMGVVLYELLTGQLPVGRFDPPTKKVPLDVRIDGIVLKALEYERDRRYERAGQMGTEIRSVTTGVRLS